MGARLTSNALPAKAIRVVLVFALVFWASFRVECFAFGDVVHDSLSKHSEGSLNDAELWQVKSLSDSDLEGKRIVSASETASGKSEARLSPIPVSSSVRLAAIPAWLDSNSKDDVLIADFLQWEVDKPECADLQVEKGIATLTGVSAGTVTVTCSLKDSDMKYVSDSFKEKYKDKPFAASFEVDIQNPSLGIELLNASGGSLEAGQIVRLSEQERQSYAFGARVSVIDPETHEAIAEFTDKDQSSLDDNLRVLLSDFEWSLKSEDGSEVGADVAFIDADGVLHMEQGGSLLVYGSVSLGEQSYSASVHVVSSDPQSGGSESSGSASDKPEADDGQGASHPQRQLRVVANSASRESEAEGESGSAPSGAASSGAAAKPDEKSDESASSASAGSGSSASAESASASSAEPGESKSINKLYSVEELAELGTSQEIYSMYGNDGWRIVEGEGPSLASLLEDAGVEDLNEIESISIEGFYGTTEVSWSDLTAARSYFPRALDGDYSNGRPSSPMIAIRSYQYSEKEIAELGESGKPVSSDGSSSASAEGSQGGSSASAEKSDAAASGGVEAGMSPDLVENTQFRLLFGATNPPGATIDPDSLRWIHTIRVNYKGKPEDDVLTDPVFKVSVSYVPVPLGSTAVFSAVPNNEIGNARFGFHWQESVDGVTWADIPNSTVQTLRILTTEDRIGHQFRVVMETDVLNEEGMKRGATSDPVTMEEGNGFSVKLEFDPPIAGDTAIFQSSVLGVDDPSTVRYEWQSSIDGGETWTTVPNRTGPQLAVPTNPIKENSSGSADGDSGGSGGSAKANPIIYIRVIAQAPDGREAYSNVMPLTVRVGDSDSDNAGNDKPGSGDSGSGDSGAGQPGSGDGGSPVPDQVVPDTPTPIVTEIDRIVYEEPSSTPVQDPQPQQPAPSSEPSASPVPTPGQQLVTPEIYINPEKSEQIVEQVQAEQERITATTPGARWTEINAVDLGGDDVRRILASNPFAPFVMPLGLGLIVAGGLERFLGFRRSIQ